MLAATIAAVLAGSTSPCADDTCLSAATAAEICSGAKNLVYDARRNVMCIPEKIDIEGSLRDRILAIKPRKGLITVLRSEGGSLPHATDIVEHLERYSYDAVVDGICASACAQLLFMGARRKIIYKDGIVAVHGGPFTDAQIEALDSDPKFKPGLREPAERFRNSIGIARSGLE